MEKPEEFKIKIKKMAKEKPNLKVVKITTTDSSNRLNEPLIDMFDKLASILQKQGEPFKARAYQKAQETIMLSKEDITKDNFFNMLKGKPGIGEAIIKKIQEFAETGTLRLLEREKENPVNILTDVYGIGPKKAKDLIAEGITNIEQLKAKKDKVLNAVQKVGLQYYEDILERIPRSEIDEYKAVFDKTFVKKGNDDKFEIVGSYRRGAKASGDIDVIITSESGKTFDQFIDDLVKQKIILEILSRGKSKCLVITRLDDSAKARRVDFLYTTPKEYPFSVLYFTGSKTFNTVMRARALTMGYSLNEHGLSHMSKKTESMTAADRKGKLVDHVFPDEQSIFKFLRMEYKTPEERVDGRGISNAVSGAVSEAESTVLSNAISGAESGVVSETKNSVLSKVVSETKNLDKPPIEIGKTIPKEEALGDKVIKIRRKKEKSVTEKIKEEHFSRLRKEFLNIILKICHNLPCPDCANHATKYLNTINFDTITTKRQLKDMLYRFHNSVNTRKNIPLFDYNELDKKYSAANTINIVHNFFQFYTERYSSSRISAHSFHRGLAINHITHWLQTNLRYFD
jgi:DNA polymerase/3'-5' exonuclease PolX